MKKTRADTLGIHLIFRSRDRKEQVVLQDADASKTVAILETGANYSSSTPHPCVSTAVHDSTTFCQLRLALFILRPRLQPLTTTILFLSPCPAPSFPFFSCRFSSKVTISNDRPWIAFSFHAVDLE